jgi:hypothetical protein
LANLRQNLKFAQLLDFGQFAISEPRGRLRC